MDNKHDENWIDLDPRIFEMYDEMVNDTYIEENPELYYENMYNRNNNQDILSQLTSTNYTNTSFCFYCRSNLVIPNTEINNFIDLYIYSNKKKHIKYLLLVFRLCPNLLPFKFVMTNKILRSTIYDFLNIDDKFKNNPDERTDLDIINDYSVYNTYIKNIKDIPQYIYEIYFNQPNLKFSDYIMCTICNNYICPMHIFLLDYICSSCNFCEKKWFVCGYCRPNFNEQYACKYIHKK